MFFPSDCRTQLLHESWNVGSLQKPWIPTMSQHEGGVDIDKFQEADTPSTIYTLSLLHQV